MYGHSSLERTQVGRQVMTALCHAAGVCHPPALDCANVEALSTLIGPRFLIKVLFTDMIS